MESSRQSRNDRLIAGGRKRGRDFCERVLKGAKARRRRLYFESLESRRLLAGEVAARFQFDDLSGRPLTSLQPGGDYLLRMFVRDGRSDPGGIKQTYFDVSYPSSLITVNGAIDHGSSFTSAPFGDSATAGLIDEVGGRDPDIPPTPASAEQLLFSVPIHANSAGTLKVTATTATRLSFFFDTVVGLQASNIAYSGGTIEIVSAGISISPSTTLQTTESGGTASFTAVLQSQPTANVSFSIASGNTNEGTVSTNNLTFTPANWNTPQTVIVSGVDDAVVDGNINFSVITGTAVSNDVRYNGFDPSNVSVTNTDNDVATLSIVAPAINESNSDQTINFVVTLNKAVNGGFTVAFNSANGTATSSNDFVLSTISPLAFTGIAGETKNISVLIKGEQIVESNETFTLTLGAVTPVDPVVAASITTGASAIGTIVNDDSATLNISSPIITESNSSQTVEFVVTLDKPVAGGFSVAFSGANGTADANDYLVNMSSPLTFLGTTGETKTIAVTINGDTVVEPNETFSIALGVVTPVAPVQASSILTNASAIGTILNDDTAIAITATDAVKPEKNSGITPFTFLVTRSGLTTGTTSVNYTVAGAGLNSADATDFGGTLPSGTINFAANETSKTITINVQGDASIESDEGFNVTLSNLSGAGLITTATAAGTIQNDDTSLAISALSASKPEGDSGFTSFTFTIARAGLLSSTNAVNFLVTGNGANPADGTDFGGTVPTGVVTFNPGDTNQTLTIRVNGDTTVEPDEGFLISLSNATGGAQLIVPSASGQIQNDDSLISLTASDAIKLEGNAGSTAFLFTVTRSGLTSSGATFNFSIAGNGTNPANATDFGGTFPAGQVIFAPNESTKTITLNVSGDLAIEPDEAFIVTLSNLSGSALATAVGTIRTDDANISIAATDGTKLEGDTGLTPFRFTVNRTGVTSGTASVNYAVSGSGLNPADATDFGGQLPSGTISFAANETSRVITINVSADTTIESDEEFTVTLSGATSGTQIAPVSAVSTIQSDEVALAIAALDSTKAEGNSATTPFTFTVTRSGGTLGTVTVNYAVTGTGANPANAADFGGTLPSGVITFNPNEKSKTLTIPVSGDATIESTETLLVTLSNASGQTQISTATALGTIQNDDSSLSIAIGTGTLPEGDSGTTAFSFTITRTGATTAAATVNYALTGFGNTPVDAADFGGTLPSGQIAFTANEISKTLTINVAGDTTVEADERFVVTLSNASGNTTITNASANATVTNDDSSTLTLSNLSQLETTGAGTALFKFDVRLSNALAGGFDLPFAATGISASLGTDFSLTTSSPLRFSGTAGEIRSISVLVNADATVEADETFNITLGAISGLSSGISASKINVPNTPAIGTIRNDDATTLSIKSVTKTEGNSGTTQFVFDVTLSAAVASGFDVAYTLAAGTANITSDLGTFSTPPLHFDGTANETHSISIPVMADTLVEISETFQITLGAISNLGSGVVPSQITVSGNPATGTIQNDDAATFTINDVTRIEGDLGQAQLVFNVDLSQAVDVPVSVSYATVDQSAQTSDNDYLATSATLTFLPGGPLSQSISVSINGDTAVEPDETFKVVLSSIDSGTPARSVTIARAEGIGTIQADDGSLLSVSDAQISEGNSGTLQLTFNVTVSKADVSPFTVDFATANGTATTADGDFVSRQGALTFTPSGPTTQSVAITINGDSKVEGDESFQLLLSNLVAISGQVLLNRSVASGKLVNDDAAVLSVDDIQSAESDSGLKSFVFNVKLSNPIDIPVTLSYATGDDTARSTGDYLPTSGTLTFNPGDALGKTVTVSVNGDALVESDEKFNLLLSNVTTTTQRDVTLGKATGVATITNDDFALVTISATRQAIEEENNGEFTIVTNSRFQIATTLTLEVNGTASSGSDYSPISTSIVFPANTDSITLPVSIIADKLVEGNETITVKLIGINSTQGKIGAQNSSTVTVSDNDSASVSIESTKSVSEVGSPFNIVVTLTTSDGKGGTATLAPGVSLSAVVVDAGGGTATSGADYSAVGSKSVTFAAGSSNGATSNVSFIPVHDTLVEGNETVLLRLQDLSTTLNGQFTVSNANCIVSIVDNDTASLAIQSTVSASEAGGAPSIVVTLSLSDGAGGPATLAPGVSFTADVVDVGGGTATSGTDYAVFGTKPVSFPVGSTNGSTATITFTPTNDMLVEGSETVRLRLQNARSASAAIATISTPDSLVTIQDNDTATLSIAGSRSITEAGNSQAILVTLTTSDGAGGIATLAPGVTVLAEVVDSGTGTASSADYAIFGKQSVSFPAGATHGATASVTVTPTNDALIEGDETLQLKLQNLVVPTAVTSQIQLGNTTSNVTIADNDTATLAFTTTSIAEGVSASVVVVTLSTSDGASGSATLAPGVTLTVEIVDAGGGTATSGTDFAAIATKTATFAAGSANSAASTITISPVNDALVEGNETIILRMQNLIAPAGSQISTASSGVITIADNDAAKLSIEAAKSFTEQGATQQLVVTLTTSDGAGGFATLAPGVNLQASVVDAATGTAVSGTDYTPFGTKSVSFAAGAANGATVSLSLESINDSLVEGDETVQLRLQNLNSTLGGQAALDNINSRLTIVDNDTARLAIATTSLLEAGGAQSFTVRLVTSNGAGGAAVLAPGVSLSAAIVDAGGGTARSGVDYVALGTKTVTFAAGAADGATENATLNLTNDSLVEGAETLNIRLQNLVSSAGGQATLDSTNTALTIQDNDTASVSIESNKTIFEQNGSQTILVKLTTSDGAGGTATLAPGISLSVQIVDAGGGTAQSGVDYQPFSTQVATFAAGEANNATKSISVTPIVHPGIDPTRSVNLRLEKVATSGNGEFGLGNSQSLVTISDAPPTSELRGLVYIDGNGNGSREPNREPGIPGVTLTLSGTDIVGGTVQLVVMSGDDGSYGFTGLRAGTYKITQTQPAAFLNGKNSTGIVGGTTASDSLANLRLETNAIVNNNNFGELGLKARFVNTRMFVGSMLGRSSQLRAVVAQAEDVVGNASQAAQIRLKNVPSVATANTLFSSTVAGPVQSLRAEGESADLARTAATKMVANNAPPATTPAGKPNATTETRSFVAPIESHRQAYVSSTDHIFSSPDLQATLQSVDWSKQYATSELPVTDSLNTTLGPRSRIWQPLRFINRPS